MPGTLEYPLLEMRLSTGSFRSQRGSDFFSGDSEVRGPICVMSFSFALSAERKLISGAAGLGLPPGDVAWQLFL